MHITKALEAEQCRVVSIIGGGGKTSLMFRLAAELAASGKRVITTTTTHILSPSPAESPELQLHPDPVSRKSYIEEALSRLGHLTLAEQSINETGKLRGYSPEIIDELRTWPFIDAILVEADGAARKPLKACASHEPAVPAGTDLLVCVVGLDCVGKMVSETVFRHEIFTQVTGLKQQELVTVDSVAEMLHHDLGEITAGSTFRTIIVLNKADNGGREKAAEEIVGAFTVRPPGRCEKVVVTRLADDFAPVRSTTDFVPRASGAAVAGIILAAGKSSRMGTMKGLLPYGGSSVLQTVINKAESSTLHSLLLVLGHESEAVREQIVLERTEIVMNPDYAAGMSTSLQAGLPVVPPECEFAMFLLGDQPLVATATLNLLVTAAQENPGTFIVPYYAGKRGNPVLAHRLFFPEISLVRGDAGARPLLARYPERVVRVEVNDPGVLVDLDTPEDYQRLCNEGTR